ncbi:MAG: hypothetical protein IJ418_09660 [Clostridia bacterium]|nr:hypothetical protein [Clostridia bacterium]
MHAKIFAVSAACLLAAAALCAAFFGLHRQPSVPTQAKSTVSPAAQDAAAEIAIPLFPDLSGMTVTALTVSTPDRSFQFRMDQSGMVSVNGQQADGEIFSTLLEQIRELPVERYDSFSPQQQNLILTLVISAGPQKHTARFYEDGGAGEKTHIVLDTGDLTEYRQTSGWRVGTLMMTCEGTRILDIHGNETPAIQ